uniref:FtsK/SpoIIIE family DNA translocase n=1 Tax=Massilibacillus massiliensis TaxID=1806837 RepID=UPI000AECF161
MRKKWLNLAKNMKYELLGIFFTTVGVISFISLIGFNVGPVGKVLAKIQEYMFGIGAIIIPIIIITLGIRYICKQTAIIYSLKFFGILFLYIDLLTIYHHFSVIPGQEILPEYLCDGGGLVGGFILFTLRKFFGVDGTIVILFSIALGSILLSTTWSLATGILKTKKHTMSGVKAAKDTIASTYDRVIEADIFHRNTDENTSFYDQEEDKRFEKLEAIKINEDNIHREEETLGFDVNYAVDVESNSEKTVASEKIELSSEAVDMQNETINSAILSDDYKIPDIATILKKVSKSKNSKLSKELAANARILEDTLESFNVKAKIVNACNGPAVTRYELEPAAGVKVSKIVNLADDLALKLAAPGVRIEAPIPGKAAIGIEVPNKELSGVHLREVLEAPDFTNAKSKLSVGLGIDIGGKAIVADLAKMPHLLVAGATGSGKSVCINTLITSILFKAKPEEVKFVLIDPKMVELSNYNGIPHLMVPVVTDSKKAASVLNWAVQEMEKRYAMFAANGVRDMERYNNSTDSEKMPAVVIIIDELADLMMVAPVDVEDAICRLAQKARAAGIHLVLATQRPSVDVITGIIKANIPSRISFSVSSQIDSRTILDMSGAEKLLGKGDMLYYPIGAAKPVRVQGAFISDSEVETLIDFIKTQGEPIENEEIIKFTENALSNEAVDTNKQEASDELLESAINLVLETGNASVSMLQRRFRIGYTRAGRLIDTMEEMRIVGPNAGSKAREILMTSEQVYNTYFNK